ncbi:hypothetical protein LX87_04520 [Larkinella arboricola]|uniref:Uncharacterized protein n=1 Tax=Larkinella arboricola TaxID=643671 RepID=A0A327WP83_LARAB|nr:hypothetical protein LX87_04520 [Larkinella arboricola]
MTPQDRLPVALNPSESREFIIMASPLVDRNEVILLLNVDHPGLINRCTDGERLP